MTVPMPPNENMCVYIEMYMERSTVQGNIGESARALSKSQHGCHVQYLAVQRTEEQL